MLIHPRFSHSRTLRPFWFATAGGLLFFSLTLLHETLFHHQPLLPLHLGLSIVLGVTFGLGLGWWFFRSRQSLITLKASEERYRDLFENANDLIQCIGSDGRIIYVNRAWREALGYDEDEIPHLRISDFIHTDCHDHCLGIFQRMQEGQTEERMELKFRTKDGRAISVEGNCNFRFENGRAISSRGIFRDVTIRKQVENALRESEESLKRSLEFTRTVLDSMNDGVAIIDVEDGLILDANNVLLRELGKREVDILGKRCQDTLCQNASFEHGEKPCPMRQTLETGQHSVVEHIHKDDGGKVRYSEVSTSPVRNSQGRIIHVVHVTKDITKRKIAELKVKQLAYFDSLTGLPNRMLLLDRLSQAIGRAKRDSTMVGVLFLDLNRFKAINDTLGHEKGDLVLKEVSRRLKGCVRDTDTVGRLAGDEFVVVIAGIQSVDIIDDIAEKIALELSQPIHLDGQTLIASPSIGASIFPLHGSNVGTLLRHADEAMYRAKEKGEGKVLFYPSATV